MHRILFILESRLAAARNAAFFLYCMRERINQEASNFNGPFQTAAKRGG